MGKKNDALLTYLEDNARFADLFNYSYFGGMQVVRKCLQITATSLQQFLLYFRAFS